MYKLYNNIISNMIANDKNIISYNDTKLTFQDIIQDSNQLANNKVFNNIKERTIVSINIKNPIIFIIVFLTLWKKGCIIIPASSWDFKSLQNILEINNISMIITDEKLEMTSNYVNILNSDLFIYENKKIKNKIHILDNRDFILMFTSGTTSIPKLVRLSYDGVYHNVQEIIRSLELGKLDKKNAIIMLPLEHGYALIGQLLVSLYSGINIHFFYNQPINKLFTLIEKENISILWTVTLFLKMIERFKIKIKSIEIVSTAGARFPFESYDKLKEIFISARFMNNYGGTEASPRISYIYDDDKEFFNQSVGKPISNTLVSISDNGCLQYKGDGIMLGYFNKDTLDDNFFITNDIAEIKNDYIYIKGRIDDTINLGGEKVSLSAIRKFLSADKNILSFVATSTSSTLSDIVEVELNTIDETIDFSKKIADNFNIKKSFIKIKFDNLLPIYNKVVKQ